MDQPPGTPEEPTCNPLGSATILSTRLRGCPVRKGRKSKGKEPKGRRAKSQEWLRTKDGWMGSESISVLPACLLSLASLVLIQLSFRTVSDRLAADRRGAHSVSRPRERRPCVTSSSGGVVGVARAAITRHLPPSARGARPLLLERFSFALPTRPRSQNRGADIPVCPKHDQSGRHGQTGMSAPRVKIHTPVCHPSENRSKNDLSGSPLSLISRKVVR